MNPSMSDAMAMSSIYRNAMRNTFKVFEVEARG